MQTFPPSSSDTSPDSLALQVIAASCSNGTCPTVYRTDRQTIVVQGYAVSSRTAGVELPEGELLVEIPVGLLREAARNMA